MVVQMSLPLTADVKEENTSSKRIKLNIEVLLLDSNVHIAEISFKAVFAKV